jgi:hypothetical protein
MERPKSSYSIHSRPTTKGNRRIYYAVFRDEAGNFQTAVSTGCTRRDDAVRRAESRLAQDRDRRENLTLAAYAQGFWKPEAPFATDRAAHGWAISRTYLDIAEGYTRIHLMPVWGGRKLRDLSAKTLNAWIVDLHRQGAGEGGIGRRTWRTRAKHLKRLNRGADRLEKPVRKPGFARMAR